MYKIIYNDNVIDVVKHPKFVRFLQFGHIALTDKTTAQGIVGSNDEDIYSFIAGHNLPKVSIELIDSTEFNRLRSLLNSGQTVSADETALAQAKQAKISALSGICKNKIVSGFTIELSDGELYNFKLTAEDQLNLMLIENQLATGEANYIYHATNQPCKIYGRDDMLKIVKAFRKHVLYHTTYFNAAKQYVNALAGIDQVNIFSYGTDVSDTVSDTVLKQILKNGGA